MDQLTQIMKVTGVPGKEFIQKLDSPEVRGRLERLLWSKYQSCLLILTPCYIALKGQKLHEEPSTLSEEGLLHLVS